MKKKLLAVTLLLGTSLSLEAYTFGAISGGYSLGDYTVENTTYAAKPFVKITGGTLGYVSESERLGYYFEVASTLSKKEKEKTLTGTTKKYQSILLNLGITYTLSQHFHILGGVGKVGMLTSKYTPDTENINEENEVKTKTNGNLGVIFSFKDLG